MLVSEKTLKCYRNIVACEGITVVSKGLKSINVNFANEHGLSAYSCLVWVALRPYSNRKLVNLVNF